MSSARSPRLGRLPLLAGPRHGPLPYFLLALTMVTGLVDAVSVLRLGRVFVANMTGNVVFVGFALARAPGFSLAASLIALGGFLAGAGACGRLVTWLAPDRGRLLQTTASVELVLFLAATIIAFLALGRSSAAIYVLAALLAPAMGFQNTTARRLAVPDATTTVLTMTLTGMAADFRSGQPGTAILRRLLSIATMLVGAILGALLVLSGHPAQALLIATLLVASVVAGVGIAGRHRPLWRQEAPRS
ncbi:MAG: DUF1275 domain-containing protein [Candidatus Dormibacteraeota bacterium]|nr:DUF1275 domain-containing protein [Candidatus Dormibacteraeota bacterium]MBO0744115.1 DUF1275 domain-containing protein [Candidatus Dormibacteraeota bacterium]